VIQMLALHVHSEHAHVGAQSNHPQGRAVRREPNDGDAQCQHFRLGPLAMAGTSPRSAMPFKFSASVK
jgi:hypothetical protein